MKELLSHVKWKEKRSIVDALMEQLDSLSCTPMNPGLEAEVVMVSSKESSLIVKVWNKESKPNVEAQYELLKALHNEGLSVSEPFGWGLDAENNQVLLTSYDGNPINKVNKMVLQDIAEIITAVHRFPIDTLDSSLLRKYDFISYFYPHIDQHLDVKKLLIQLYEQSQMTQDTLIHGDINFGNIMEDEGEYTLIDWTNGQLGDPRYDIAWSILLMQIYVGDRYSSVYRNIFLTQYQYSTTELELFEAIACLRWILLNRVTALPMRKDTLKRVRGILNNNSYLTEDLLSV